MKTTTSTIDPINTVIAKATTNGDRGALRAVLAIVTKATPAKRAAIWDHFAVRIGKRVRFLIPELRKAFDLFETDKLDPKSNAFDAKAYGEQMIKDKRRRSSASSDGDQHAPSE